MRCLTQTAFCGFFDAFLSNAEREMKTSEQIVVRDGQGGPYRSMDLTSRERRTRLIREIDFLERVQEWRAHALLKKSQPVTRQFQGLFQVTSTLFVLAAFAYGLIRGNPFAIMAAIMLLLNIWILRFDIMLLLQWRNGGDPAPLIKQKLDELANMPPE